MRAVVLFSLIFLSCAAAQAQQTPPQSKEDEKEKSRMDRVLKPDQNRVNPIQNKQFYGGKDFGKPQSGAAKPFYISKQPVAKNAFVTHEYGGVKTFAGSNRDFSTKEFPTRSASWLSNVTHFFSGKKVETKQTYDAGKTYDTSGVVNTRAYRGPETKAVAQTFQNTDKKMSVADVRELLNKNK